MRTHIFNKMTAGEIDAYLSAGNDAIFVAVGVTEIHGEAPVDVECIRAEGLAVAMAENCGAVALVNLPFFYPGGTVVGNGTIHTSIAESYQYLWKILKSLVDQGFKKIFLIPGHSSIELVINALIRDFFEAFHIHPVMITSKFVSDAQKEKVERFDMRFFETVNAGAYRILKLEEYLPVNPDAKDDFGERVPDDPIMNRFAWKARAFGGVAALAYSDPRMHGGGLVFKSVKERSETCAKGEKIIREAVETLDLKDLLDTVGAYQDYVRDTVLPKFPRFAKLP